MSGLELADRLRQRQPELPVVLMSGHGAGDDSVHEALKAKRSAHVAKPIRLEELLHAMRRLIAPKESAPTRSSGALAEGSAS